MSQYTSTSTSPGGTTVNSVFDTATNTIIITATSPNGVVATTAVSANGDIIDAVVSLRNQWTSQGTAVNATELSSGIRNGVISTVNDVKKQSSTAGAVATETNTSPPAENQAIPTDNKADPAVPKTQTEPESPTEQVVIDALDDKTAAVPEPTVEPTPTSQDVIDAEEDPFVQSEMIAAQTEPEPPTEQTVIDALDDETAAMAEPITAEEPTSQSVIDAEEDPFLQSEMIAAQTELEPPTSQDVIDAEEDPFLQSEMIAAQSEQEPPTEQTVIDALDDETAALAEPIEYEEPPTEQAVIDALDDETAAMADAAAADAPEYIPPTDEDVRSATNAQGLQNVNSPNAQASAQDEVNFNLQKDWRVRLSLAEGAYYLYENKDSPGILAPLADTKGVIFPYTPQIQVQYVANYDPTTVTHSNYKIYQYNSSSIDNITITGDFTAQDTFEANYLLAVIHFFRSVTKMFYAQDKDPKAGTPPPLCYLHGLGAFQFDTHPLVITSFNYNLPNNVDYIRASINEQTKIGPDSGGTTGTASQARLKGISPGGRPMPVQFATGPKNQKEPTYVPTKIQLQISAAPMISRNQISNDFSVKQYATGELLRGSKRQKPGVW